MISITALQEHVEGLEHAGVLDLLGDVLTWPTYAPRIETGIRNQEALRLYIAVREAGPGADLAGAKKFLKSCYDWPELASKWVEG